jgi:uncharacterized alpha/beta hydrolase family protein
MFNFKSFEMKKVFLITLLISLFGFIFMGCNKDEDNTTNNQVIQPTVNKALELAP